MHRKHCRPPIHMNRETAMLSNYATKEKSLKSFWKHIFISCDKVGFFKSFLLILLPSTQSLKPLHVSKPYWAGHVIFKQQLFCVFFWLLVHALGCRSLLPRQCFHQGLSAEWRVHIRPSDSACMSSAISMLKLGNCRHLLDSYHLL